MSNKNNIKFDFNKINIPQPIESTSKDETKMITWGSNNLYPDYLLSLYHKSPIHSNIINQKAIHLVGECLINKLNNKKFDIKVNVHDTIDLFLDKIVKDFLLFNAFAVEINFNPFQQPTSYNFIPFNRVRLNNSKTKVFYSDDFSKSGNVITYERYIAGASYEDSKSKVFIYEGYTPSTSIVYPEAEYKSLIKNLAIDIAITDFNFNQITSHFSVSTLITFFNGDDIDDDVKAKVLRDLKNVYTGENGQKFIIDFQSPNGTAADIKNISAGDWHDAFNAIREAVESTIYKGHNITSPALFGEKTAGQLGNTQELENAYEIWANSYLRTKRNQLESALFDLFGVQLEFKHKALFSSSLDFATKEKVYTINELRAIDGLKPISNGDRLISDVPVAPTNEQFSKQDLVKTELTEEDYEKIKHLGLSASDFEILTPLNFAKEDDIANYLIENDVKNLNHEEIVERLKEAGIKTDVKELKETLTKLQDSGLIKVTDTEDAGRIKIVPAKVGDVEDSRAVQVMYKYEKRAGIDGDTIIPTSRAFCKKIIENDKFYTRSEIQQFSDIFGYNIFKYCGGHYTNSVTGEQTPYCRHEWKSYRVAKKGGSK